MAVIDRSNVIAGAVKRQPLLSGAGAPTANVTGLGAASIGDQYLNTSNGVLYVVTATDGTSTITWTVVGSQV